MLAIWVLGAPGSAEGTVVRALDLNQKVGVAPVIVHGIVERVASEWVIPGAQIRTMVTVVVIDSLKGDVPTGERLLVERTGGTIDRTTQSTPGTSPYSLGEEVIMFLEPLGAHYVAIGIGIGKYDVLTVDGERVVHHAPQVYGLRYSQGSSIVEPIPPMSPEPLAAFLKRVRTIAQRPAGQPGSSAPKIQPGPQGRVGARLKAPFEIPARGR